MWELSLRLRWMRKLVVVLGLFTSFSWAHAYLETTTKPLSELVQLPRIEKNQEAILTIDYDVHCDAKDLKTFQGYVGSVQIGEVTKRFDLFAATRRTELILGPGTEPIEKATVTLNPVENCQLKRINYAIELVDVELPQEGNPFSDAALAKKLAVKWAPYVNVRENQLSAPDAVSPERFTDLGLAMAYSVVAPKHGGVATLLYTYFLSDEDSNPKGSRSAAAGQMGRYGRYSDIEWVYAVELDKALRPIHQEFQGVFHFRRPFTGKTLGDSSHPILWDVANNNIFADASKIRFEGYHLVPRERIESPDAREIVMFRNPWMFEACDQEMVREDKLQQYAIDYLFARFTGKLEGGSFLGKVTFADGTVQMSGNGAKEVDRLGEDLFGKEAYSAIPVGRETLNNWKDKHGEFGIITNGTRKLELSLEKPVRFYRIKSVNGHYAVEEITNLFQEKARGQYSF